jgi:hypothetical protein
MPVTALVFWIAAFSISGVPLFNGYVSKGMVLMAAEQTSILLWVLLEIASFGTLVSFLKIGYFAFLRPGETQASDPPKLMQAGMLGAAALCVIIGVYPPVLYALLPYPTTYAAYAPVHLLGALVVLGAAAIFFFTIGRRLLEPHDTRLRDVDVVYAAAGHGTFSVARGLCGVFRRVYGYALTASGFLFSSGRLAMGAEDRSTSWNFAVFGIVIVACILVVVMGVN